jgi:predicted acetyltransferase
MSKALMRTMFDIARELRLSKVWVGTETDNVPTNSYILTRLKRR